MVAAAVVSPLAARLSLLRRRPDFDGHEVDFDELMNRNSIYKAREAELTETHICRMDKLANELIK